MVIMKILFVLPFSVLLAGNNPSLIPLRFEIVYIPDRRVVNYT